MWPLRVDTGTRLAGDPLGSRDSISQSNWLAGQTSRSCLRKSFPLSLTLTKGTQSRGRVPAPERASKGGQCAGGLSNSHRSQGGINCCRCISNAWGLVQGLNY